MKNVMNRNLEEDFKFEQDLNLKMESDIWKFDAERTRLQNKCVEQEGAIQ